MDIRDKVALVTGAGSGIGQATALRLAAEGASVVVDDIDEESGCATVAAIAAAAGSAAFVQADVSNEDDVRGMIAFAEETYGGLDILVNNAGGGMQAPHFPDNDAERWRRVVNVYLLGTMHGVQQGIQSLRRRGRGAIVNIASLAGIGYDAHPIPEYAASKAAVVRLTSSLMLLGKEDIRVNCICPGWVDTPQSRRTRAAMTPEELASVPDPMLTPEEIAGAVVQLVRDDALAGRVLYYFGPGEQRLATVRDAS